MGKVSFGFTLIELLVVIAVLGVLAAGVFTAINPLKRIQQANDAKIKSDIGQIAQAMQAFYTGSVTSGTPYYPGVMDTLISSGELKSKPKTPANTDYTITGREVVRTVSDEDCTTPDRKCGNVTVSAQMNEDSTKYYCWDSTNGTAKISSSKPGVAATTCPL